MSAHPTRRKNRTRGRSGLAREPFALGIALAENPNRGKRDAATVGFHARQASLAARIARLERPELFPAESVSFPGRDSLGRRNPRMPRRRIA